MIVKISDYEQLQQLCWNRPEDATVTGEEALSLYERNWRFVEVEKLKDKEIQLLSMLTFEYGNSVFL